MNMKLLHDMIEDQKKELGYLVKKYGFRHQKVISVSQKLDLLVYKAMNIYRLDH
ncbi:aspartyl-phosphate phosphatase Spo0E family protein [Bacillus thuringiensis]|nr:aspartyl-phosphate phosphatase Spo0E family protein [Bacillus thuringiensis]